MNVALKEFQNALESNQVVSDPSSLSSYGKDWLKIYEPRPTAILFPRSTEEVATIVSIARKHKAILVPSGGRTGLSGGATATAGEYIVSLERLSPYLEVNTIDHTIRCSANTTTVRVQEAAKEHGLYFPVDFASAGSSHIGGNVATNAGGIRVLKYGCIRPYVLGLTVVTGRGEILNLNGALYKNQTGYSLQSLFIGSEGTLGIITDVTLTLKAAPGPLLRVLCGLQSQKDILPLLESLRKEFSEVSVFELFPREGLELVMKHHGVRDPFESPFPYYILVELEDATIALQEKAESFFFEALEDERLAYVILSHNEKQLQELLSLRELLPETLTSHYIVHKNDISVPIPSIPEFMESLKTTVNKAYPTYSIVIFGHVGDGNLHVNVIKPDEVALEDFKKHCKQNDKEIFSLVQSYRGSISAEHGVGLLKKSALHYSRSEEEIALMREIKAVFDPDAILNRGKIFD